MASENETVDSIADCIRHMADNLPNGVILNIAQCNFIANRFESAWRRERKQLIAENQLYKQELTHERTKTHLAKSEAAELRECLREAVDVICEDCDITDDFGNPKCKNCKWRNALAKASGESEVAK